jgi:hypothetical protein
VAHERHVLDHVTGHRLQPAGPQQGQASNGHALPVGQLSTGRSDAVVAGRPEAIHQRGQHGRVQPLRAGRGAFEATADRHHVQPVVHRTCDERAG